MNPKFKSTNHASKVIAAIATLAATRVLVGVPAAKANRDSKPGQPSSPINNAELAYIHEHGAPEVNIPARPFLLPGIKNVKADIDARLAMAGIAAFSGDMPTVNKRLMETGLIAQRAIQDKIRTGPFVPLSPRTILGRLRRLQRYKKASRGKRQQMRGAWMQGTFNPLMDTNQMLKSISFVIRKI